MKEGRFYVLGGEYADTSFTIIADGGAEERHGPYSLREAHDIWRALTGKTVDNCLVRYRIKPEDEVAGETWYVVGGEYATTAFETVAEGEKLESYGPFSRPEALAVWRALTGKTVDNAMIRYSIVDEEERAAFLAGA
jgi:hypothetical protein